MSLSSPLLLVVGVLVLAGLVTAAVRLGRQRSAALRRAGLTPSGRLGQGGLWCTVAGVGVLAVAAAGPTASVPVPQSTGTVVVAVDVSNSMGADDVRPTRLALAQRAAKAVVEAQPDNVKVGVVAFEQGALTTSRPSTDHTAALAAVDRLRVTGGTSLAAAILASLSAITGRPVALKRDGSAPTGLGYWSSATVVLVSDGEDEGDPDRTEAAATAAQNAGIHVDTVGVGTTEGTVVDVDGYRLRTALDEDTLKGIATTTGGDYHAATGAADLDDVASGIDLRLEVADRELPLAGAFAAAALLLLALGAVLTVRRTGRIV